MNIRTTAGAGLLAAVIGVAIVACGSSPAQTDDPNNTSAKIADNGRYGTYLDTHVIDGQTVRCLVKTGAATLTMSCDWPNS